MTPPLWALFAFSLWTLLILFSTVGIYRWSRILTGRATVREWTADASGDGWYKRAMRAHMNCVENLPVFGAIIVVAALAGIGSPLFSAMAIVVVIGRVAHSLAHITLPQTEFVASVRFAFYFIQIIAMLIMAGMIVLSVV